MKNLLHSLLFALLCLPAAWAQNECDNAGLQSLPSGVVTDSSGIRHQTICWNPATAVLSLPLSSTGGAVSSVFGRTGAVVASTNDYASVSPNLALGAAGGAELNLFATSFNLVDDGGGANVRSNFATDGDLDVAGNNGTFGGFLKMGVSPHGVDLESSLGDVTIVAASTKNISFNTSGGGAVLINGSAPASLSGTGVVRQTGVATELSGDAVTAGSNAVTVKALNGTSLAGLATGILKNTTATGVPSIAVANTDYVTPSGNITGTSSNVTGVVAIANGGTNTNTAAAGAMPNTTSATASTWTATPTLGGVGVGTGGITYAGNTSGTAGPMGCTTATCPLWGNTGQNVVFAKLNSGTNCANAASPAVCGSASSGAVSVPTGTNPTLTINTTQVTAQSRFSLQIDESLTGIGTCNTSLATLVQPVVTARVAGTSFTIQIGAVIATNNVCVSYGIIN